jgi:outer membrane protein assembly factor BamD
MSRHRRPRPTYSYLALCAAALSGLVGCARGFQVSKYSSSTTALYQAGLREYQKKHWDNAVSAFEKLTLELPARDTLLPRSQYYLGQAHVKRGENLLAAQAFSRLVESFPDDTLADDALIESAEAYKRLWRKPVLDEQYGETAIETYRTLLSLYPNSPLRDRATKGIAQLEEWLAAKDYNAGMFYMRRKAYDSAIIYFRDVTKTYPSTDKARQSYLKLAEAYKKIRYQDDLADVCATLRQNYPGDRSVRSTCGSVPVTAATPPPAVQPVQAQPAH